MSGTVSPQGPGPLLCAPPHRRQAGELGERTYPPLCPRLKKGKTYQEVHCKYVKVTQLLYTKHVLSASQMYSGLLWELNHKKYIMEPEKSPQQDNENDGGELKVCHLKTRQKSAGMIGMRKGEMRVSLSP